MNLLPKSHQDFSQKEYWNTFFSKRGKKAFEWYGEFPELCEQINKYIKVKDDILIIGCGNSNLSMDLYDVGYRNIINIDISQVVIRQMQELNTQTRPDMKFIHMDALHMSFQPDQFSVILDKGTLDALMPNDTPEVLEQIQQLFDEISRVLRPGGRYFCVSLLQEHILHTLLEYFPKQNWMFRIVRCHEAERKTAENGENSMPVFVVICTKFKQLPNMILETCLAGEKMLRHNSPAEITSTIKSIQQAALVLSGLNKNSLSDQDEVSFTLYSPGNSNPRYTIYIMDQPFERSNNPYAAFIVPQGRETEWLFSTKDGRKKLLKQANYTRLAIVTMHRGHEYQNLDAVKEELSDSVRNLAPSTLKDTAIPYLSLGKDVGKREIKYEGTSEYSGPYLVEDITQDNGQMFRRLIFLNNQNIVQSEAKLKFSKSRNNKRKLVVDPGYLACQHHTYMSLGTQLACTAQSRSNIAIIGLGGGGLCTFLNHLNSDLNITAIDIDPSMLQVAENWFELKQTDRLTVTIQDGLEFINNVAKNGIKYQAILFDVDSKDATLGISCPPKEFLDSSILENVKNCLNDTGIFILNLVLRDESLRPAIFKTLKSKFRSIITCELDEDLNEIILCRSVKNLNLDKWKNELKIAVEQINKDVKKKRLQSDEFLDLSTLLETIKIL